MTHRDLLDLGIDWGRPVPEGETASIRRFQTGFTRDHASTVSLLAALDALNKDNRLHLIAGPQVVARDGHASRLTVLSSQGSVLPLTGSTPADDGIMVSITPTIGDHNDIVIEVATEAADDGPSGSSHDAAAQRQSPVCLVTIQNGATVVLTGLVPKFLDSPIFKELHRNEGKDAPPQELVFFLTASLIPETTGPQASNQ